MQLFLQTFFYNDDWIIIVSLTSFFALTGAFLVWVTHHSAYKEFISSFNGVNPAITAPVAIMFAFSAAMMASVIWGNFSANTESIKSERQAVFSYLELVNNEPIFANQGLQPLLKEYLQSALNDEWQLLPNEQISPKTSAIFNRLYRKSIDVASSAKPPLIGAALTRQMELLYQARLNRIGFRWHNIDSLRWVVILSVGLLLQLVVCVTHISAEKRPMGLAIGIISAFIIIIVVALGLSIDQYEGIVHVSNAPLQFALDALK